MTDHLLNAVKRHVSGMIGQIGHTRMGTITSVNASNYTARVLIQPEGVLSGWLPIAATMVGSGWGLVSPPSNGEQVVVLAQEGDSEHGIIVGRVFSNDHQPPKTYTDQYAKDKTNNVQPGEIGLVHKNGTFLRLIGDRVLIHGDLFVDGQVRVTGDITSDKNVLATLNVQAKKDVTAGVNMTAALNVSDKNGAVETIRVTYNHHQHGTSGPPTPLLIPE
jgi:phage baseplate assembly protein V